MPAKEALVKQLGGDDKFAATLSAWALAHIDPKCRETAAKTVPLLAAALEKPNPEARTEAAAALKCLGPLAKPAVPALKKALGDSDAAVRRTAAEALKAVGDGK